MDRSGASGQLDLIGLRDQSFSFDDVDVFVDRKVANTVDSLAGRRPMYLDFFDGASGSNTENFTRIMRREITAAVILQAEALFASCGPVDLCSDGVAVAGNAF